MHEKLINSPLAVAENDGFLPRGTVVRAVKIPAQLTEDRLIRMNPAEIEALLAVEGKAVGLAAMVKLAAGIDGTPPGTQFAAAKFLIERDDLRQADARDRDQSARQLTRSQLLEVIAQLEEEGVMLPINHEPPLEG